MVTGGRNMGRVGVITHRERHDGGFNIVHIKDAIDNSFATREANVFVIGSEKPWVSLPQGKGVKVGPWSFALQNCCEMLTFPSSQSQRKGIDVAHRQLQAIDEYDDDRSTGLQVFMMRPVAESYLHLSRVAVGNISTRPLC